MHRFVQICTLFMPSLIGCLYRHNTMYRHCAHSLLGLYTFCTRSIHIFIKDIAFFLSHFLHYTINIVWWPILPYFANLENLLLSLIFKICILVIKNSSKRRDDLYKQCIHFVHRRSKRCISDVHTTYSITDDDRFSEIFLFGRIHTDCIRALHGLSRTLDGPRTAFSGLVHTLYGP